MLLTTYRAMPGKDGLSPGEKLHGRQSRTIISLLQPRKEYDTRKHQHKFPIRSKVLIRTFKDNPKWTTGKIVKIEGARVYTVYTKFKIVKRHQEHIRERIHAIPDIDEVEAPSIPQRVRALTQLTNFQDSSTAAAFQSSPQPAEQILEQLIPLRRAVQRCHDGATAPVSRTASASGSNNRRRHHN